MVAELAAREARNAERLQRRPAFDRLDEIRKPIEAQRAREESVRLLKAPEALVGAAATELVPARTDNEQLSPARLSWLDTLATPNVIAVDASEHRASLATRANVLSEALDAQLTTHAANSIEKMLCHQMAVAHTAAMETFIRLLEAPT